MARSSYLAPILQSHPIRSAAHRRPAGVRPGATWKQRPGSHCRESSVCGKPLCGEPLLRQYSPSATLPRAGSRGGPGTRPSHL